MKSWLRSIGARGGIKREAAESVDRLLRYHASTNVMRLVLLEPQWVRTDVYMNACGKGTILAHTHTHTNCEYKSDGPFVLEPRSRQQRMNNCHANGAYVVWSCLYTRTPPRAVSLYGHRPKGGWHTTRALLAYRRGER